MAKVSHEEAMKQLMGEFTEQQLADARNTRSACYRCDTFTEEIECLTQLIADAEQRGKEAAWDEGCAYGRAHEKSMAMTAPVNPYRAKKDES